MGYMVSLRVRGRLCVIVGGGRAAYLKAEKLLGAGARVRIIAPEISPEIEALPVESVIKSYDKTDLSGAFLVFALTDAAHVNERVRKDAESIGALVCFGDQGDFEVPASYQGENMEAAVITGYPKLSGRLVRELMQYDKLCGVLREYRQQVLSGCPDSGEKERLLSFAVTDEMLRLGLQSIDEFKKIISAGI